MSTVVLSIGSNLGDRLARLQSVVDGLGTRVSAVSPVYETDPWGGVEQGPFLNAVVIAEDPDLDARGWLDCAQALERAAERLRGQKWGPRTLDVDLVTCRDESVDVISREDGLTLPHPLAHLRAFVLIPWLAVDPDATLTVTDAVVPVSRLLADLPAEDRAGVRVTHWCSVSPPDGPTRKRDLAGGVVAAAVLGYLLVLMSYRYFPPLTVWTGLSLAAVGVAEALWGWHIRAKIGAGEIGVGGGRVHPLAVARSVVIAKASAWMGAVVLGWWIAVLAYLIPRRTTIRVAGEDTAGAVVAALCALVLVVAALWLQHCCKSPPDLTDAEEGVTD